MALFLYPLSMMNFIGDILGIVPGQKLKANTYSIKDNGYNCRVSAPRLAADLCPSRLQGYDHISDISLIFHVAHIGSQGICQGGCTGTHQVMPGHATMSMALYSKPVIFSVICNINQFLLPFLVAPSLLG